MKHIMHFAIKKINQETQSSQYIQSNQMVTLPLNKCSFWSIIWGLYKACSCKKHTMIGKSPLLLEQRERKEGCPDSACARLDGVVCSRGSSANDSPPRPLHVLRALCDKEKKTFTALISDFYWVFFNAKSAEVTQRAQRYLYFISIFSKDRQRPLRVLWVLCVKE